MAETQHEYKILAHGSGGWIDQDLGEDQPKHKVLGPLLNECGGEGWQVVGTYQTPTEHQPRIILIRTRGRSSRSGGGNRQ
jgi:hypothetical protein